MQSLYSMAPSLCTLFVNLKTNSLSKLILPNKKKKRRTKKDESIAYAGVWHLSHSTTPDPASTSVAYSPPRPSLQLSRLSEPRRHSNYLGSPPRCSIQYGRNSDVGAGFPRLSTSSSSCYERLSVEYQGAGGLDLPRMVKLGALSDESSELRQQESRMSGANRHSTCSATSFVSSTSSKLKGVYARQRDMLMKDNVRQQPHIGQLFAGNQFLTHVTAAPPVPIVPCEHSLLQPSPGLLDAHLRCRHAELKDRIILFL